MVPYNWKEFTKRIPVKASAKAIYDAWTTQAGLESWFLRLAEFTRPGGKPRPKNEHTEAGDNYKWLWHGYPDHVVESRQILVANGWDSLRFSFSGDCIVTVNIKQEEGETICELQQQMPMEDQTLQQYYFIECGGGWTFYLTNLKSVLEGGIDLRNRNGGLEKLINS